jgi:sulfite exporter TauE/SafE
MKRPLLEKRNYQIIIAGIILIAIGFILMSGGRSDDPEVFNPEIYNFRRIRLAPTLIIIGLALQAYAILCRPKK